MKPPRESLIGPDGEAREITAEDLEQKVVTPSREEDARITAAAKADPDNPPLDDVFFKRVRRGRAAFPAGKRKE